MQLDDSGEFEELIEVVHEFEVDLRCLVTTNHQITMEGIEREEGEVLSEAEDDFGLEADREMVDSMLSHMSSFYEDLKVTARNLAVVALVTRLHHWVSRYARRLNPPRKQQPLGTELRFLNSELQHDGPVAVSFFEELEELRHSVIHADSVPRWVDPKGRTREVAPRYTHGDWRVEINADDLATAVDAAVQQIKWYDDKLQAIGK